MIGRRGERGSGISVLAARHDDGDDDVYIYMILYIYIYIYVYIPNYKHNIYHGLVKFISLTPCQLLMGYLMTKFDSFVFPYYDIFNVPLQYFFKMVSNIRI